MSDKQPIPLREAIDTEALGEADAEIERLEHAQDDLRSVLRATTSELGAARTARDRAIRERDDLQALIDANQPALASQLLTARTELAEAKRAMVCRAACPLHEGQEHVLVSGPAMCVIGLRGLDDGWPAIEADLGRYRAALESVLRRTGPDDRAVILAMRQDAREALEGSSARGTPEALLASLDDPLADVPPPELMRLLRILDGTDVGRTAFTGFYSSGPRDRMPPEWDVLDGETRRRWQAGGEFVVGALADALAALAREHAEAPEALPCGREPRG